MASLLSEVKGICVDDTWVRKIAGPEGIPLPDVCSRPYRRQSIEAMDCVETQSPCWYRRGTRLAKRRSLTELSFVRLPP